MLTVSQEEEKKPFPNINKLALKTFLQRFNEQYSETLGENQKSLLNKYVTSYKDDGLELQLFLYEEIDRLRETLQEQINSNNENSPKLKMVLEKINSYNNKKLDKKLVTEVLKIQSLVGEFNNGD